MKDTKIVLSNNKKAFFDYYIEEKFEAGIVLVGTEVKSVKQAKCSIKESYIKIDNNECTIIGMNVTPYENGNIWNIDPMRTRKLLLHKEQIRKLNSAVTVKGYTIVPLQVYMINGLVKVEIGLAKGKHNYDKRQTIKERDIKRNAERY